MTTYVTPAETAKVLSVHYRTVCRWCRAGRVDGAIKTPGGEWRIPAGWLAEYVARSQTSVTKSGQSADDDLTRNDGTGQTH